MHEYLGLDRGRPMFRQDFTCPALLKDFCYSTCTGLSPTSVKFSNSFHFIHKSHWPGPRSLATTSGVSFDVLSSGYLDVSVPRFASNTYVFSVRYLITITRKLFGSRSRAVRILAGCWRSAGRPTWADTYRSVWAHTHPASLQQNRFSSYLRWVAPFGNRRIKGYSHLPDAYRSVSRPSSPVHAKASTKCP